MQELVITETGELIPVDKWTDKQWFSYVDESRGKSIQSLLEYCGRLAEAQNDRHYDHGNSFGKWALKYLGLKKSMASQLAKIGQDKRFSTAKQLPCDQTMLYELTKLDDDELYEYMDSDFDKSRAGLKQHKTAKNKAERTRIPELPAISERYRLYNCACSDLHMNSISSADWIITDPPYPKEFLSVYSDLSLTASRMLNPGGALVCMVGQSFLPEVISRLSEHLTYYWTFAYITHGQSAGLRHKAINTDWKPILIYVNDGYSGPHVSDTFISDSNDKEHHHWGQSVSGMNDIITRFTKPGETIVDPFLGGGTTCLSALMNNRKFIGCDIDQSCIDTTLVRVQEWQEEN